MNSIYKIIEIVGSSATTWEDAARKAMETAAKSLKEVRIGEIKGFDVRMENGKVIEYRVKIAVSFKYLPE